MKKVSTLLTAATAILLGACLAGSASAAVVCSAVGDVEGTGDGTFTYCITVTWGLNGAAVPERIDLLVDNLTQCEFYNPGDPIQARYIQPVGGTSTAAGGCYDESGYPIDEIAWVGQVAYEDPDCAVQALHVGYTNSGATSHCTPLSEDDGVFCFKSYGVPLPVHTYYNAIVIRAGEYCLFCDYTGPLPDCNMWSPVSAVRWGTIKALYR
jgi:hypothetical protein